jgi:GPH family glycoside/pentoside/hexuronide:cation symporter
MRLYALIFVENAGTHALSALGPFVTAYLIGDESTLPWVIGAYVIGSVGAIPMVSHLGRALGKRRVWSASMLLTAAAFGALYFVGPGDVGLLAGCAVVVGVGDCCAAVLGRSLLADTIDFDHAQTGERKEASYFSVWSFAQKASYGVTVALAGWALQIAGYRPDDAANPDVEAVLRWALSLVPATAYLVGFVISLGYRLRGEA